MQFLTQGSLFIFAWTKGIVDRKGGYFVWNLSCDRLISAILIKQFSKKNHEGHDKKYTLCC